ncbi:Multidrug efflux pump subunit AcrB [Pseudarcicella hirudinis]|uniref:Multidrug efflux pump subunit AcrB n=1 Tax=Pseudarcicella hirudinis TaxID=1079859 RepID=A0A1I5QX79_9BACT|nr:efflux RND transporter permease subunit [Pseudarcicella hirudinis]SFP50416.1 Multidrug efflux pump subunit AcrB [Pseudarcicella hirudinis]
MIRFLIFRPIAVLVTTLSLVILGLITFQQIPVSLLPDISVPEISVQINYPSASAQELNQTITKRVLNQLQQVNHLDDIQAESRDGSVILKLSFDYGSNINLAYVETNEKIDAIISSLPRDMERPLVIKAGATDIPVFNLNVWQNNLSYPLQKNELKTKEDFLLLSDFCENVLRRRIEQLNEVALVDITGLSKSEVVITPDQAKFQSLGIDEQYLKNVLQENNIDLGNFAVKDGQYQYNIRFSSVLKTTQDIENIYFRKGEKVFQLKEIASVKIREQKLNGFYTYNGNRAVCLSIIKQSDSQLLKLQEELSREINQYKKDYPQLSFAISQDQTELLNLSINNLIGNILFGGLCTFIMIFFFMNDFKTPIIVGMVIPVSLAITFLCFYLFHISINIVSLAGLVLGIGEIIDSAIIVIESIEQYREENNDLETSCINGTQEVIIPLFTSILTNSAVFLPLIFMSGIAGALFIDQALAVSISLGISLLCSYTFVPILYRVFYFKQYEFKPYTTFLGKKTEQLYDCFFDIVFNYKKSFFIFFIIIGILAIPLFLTIKKQGMPVVSHNELETKIDWNEPITVEENEKRLKELRKVIQTKIISQSNFIGQQQFILNRDLQQNFNECLLICKVKSNTDFEYLKNEIITFLQSKYPTASSKIRAGKNVFEQLFNTNETPLRAKISSDIEADIPDIKSINSLHNLFLKNQLVTPPPALQNRVYIKIDPEKLLIYDVTYETVYQKLKTIFNENTIGNLKSEQKYIPILISDDQKKTFENIQNSIVNTKQGNFISLSQLILLTTKQDYKSYFQSKDGSFIPFEFDSEKVEEDQRKIKEIVNNTNDLNVHFSGVFFKNQALIRELLYILLVAIGLLYFILSAQFESLTQPFIVMLTIIFGLTGAEFLLWLGGNSINIMSVIGMIVLIGILDNDSILKIDTMNRSINSMGLLDAIKMSGKKRLKSQIMTFLTTILGLLPILFSGGLGSELQQPLALAVIGGMFLGLLISLSFIPLIYWLSNYYSLQK